MRKRTKRKKEKRERERERERERGEETRSKEITAFKISLGVSAGVQASLSWGIPHISPVSLTLQWKIYPRVKFFMTCKHTLVVQRSLGGEAG